MKKLNIGITDDFQLLFWEFIDTNKVTEKNNKKSKYHFIYLIVDEYYSTPQPLYIGITQNPHRCILNHLNSSAGNWILILYRAKYPDHPISMKLLYKSENLEQARFKEADLIREYSNQYIIQ